MALRIRSASTPIESAGVSVSTAMNSSPPTGRGRPRSGSPPGGGGHLDEHRVAGEVAVAVVDVLEMVDVDQQHTDGAAVAAGRADHPSQVLVEVAAVEDPGEYVDARARSSSALRARSSSCSDLVLSAALTRATSSSLASNELAQVVVGTEAEPGDHVGGVDPAVQEDHRDVAEVGVRLEPLEGGVPIEHRHLDIEEDHVGAVLPAGGDRLLAGPRPAREREREVMMMMNRERGMVKNDDDKK